MRKLALLGCLFILVGCGGNLAGDLIFANDTIASANRAAGMALERDHITIKQACKVSEHSKVAAEAIDQAWVEWVLNDPESAEEHLRAAQAAISGVSLEAIARAEHNCGGTAP